MKDDLGRFLRPILFFVVLDLAFTLAGVLAYEPSQPRGEFRGLPNIPIKAVQFLVFGLALGAVVSLGRRKLALGILSPFAYLAFLDLDHLPSMIGILQPIRPAHSLIFIIVVVFGTYLIDKRRWGVSMIAVSAFLAHLGLDSPLFPLLAPVRYDLITFGSSASVTLTTLSFVFAWFGGKFLNRKTNVGPGN